MKYLHCLVLVAMDMLCDSLKCVCLTAAIIACMCLGFSVRGHAECVSRPYVDVRGQEEIIGTWKACRLPSHLLRPSTDITWKEICFATNGLVTIILSDDDGNSARKLAGAYAFLNKAKAGYASKHEIRIWLKGVKDASPVVLHNVRIGEFSCFPRGRHVLWFRDDNGMDCVYEPLLNGMVNTNRCIEVNSLITEDPADSTVSKDKRKGVRFSQKLCEGLIRAAPDVYEQHKAILSIMNEGDSSCVPALIPFTMPDKDSLLRQDAVKALGEIGSPSAVARLTEMLKTPVVSRQYAEDEDDAVLRRTIVLALDAAGDVSALPALESVVSSKADYDSVRQLAQSAVERLSKRKNNVTDHRLD